MPYKQVFAHIYAAPLPTHAPLAEQVVLLPDGRLSVALGATPDILDLGLGSDTLSSKLALSGAHAHQHARTPDGRYRLELDFFDHNESTEFWLVHTDAATGRVRRIKLSTESPDPSQATPRVAVSPGGNFFLVDDGGVIRLYHAAYLTEAGVFQAAHSDTGNAVIALAVSADERIIAGLSLWKDVIVYDVEQQRVAFVRQIRDSVGWYDPHPAYLLLASDAEVIVSVGASGDALSVNAFQWVSLS